MEKLIAYKESLMQKSSRPMRSCEGKVQTIEIRQ
jgi:hypothetical protein